MILRPRRGVALALSLAFPAGALSTPARAQTAQQPADPRAEARERYARGLALFNDGDNAGALAEFKRAYDLVPNPVALYNIGLVYAAMGRPVDAVDTLDQVLKNPGPLPADDVTRAKQARAEQAQRIAELAITTSVPARIDIDGIDVGQAPLPSPVRVAGGLHVVGAVAKGYAPARKEVTIAGGRKADVALDLVEMQGRIAHVIVATHLPAADVLIDDQVVGKTPLPQSISVPPGHHVITLRRVGYFPARQELSLGDGADGTVTLEPEEDPGALATTGGALALDVTELEPIVTVDGKRRGVYTASIRLPSGPHHLLVERGGFEPSEREVVVAQGATATVKVVLDPTPDTRAAWVSRTTSQRTWGIVAVASGAVVAAGAVGFLVWNGHQRSDAYTKFDAGEAQLEARTGVCDTMSTEGNAAACNAAVTGPQSDISDANTRAAFGYIGLGVGVATAGLGVVLLLTDGDPHRYDRAGASATWSPWGWGDARGGGAGVRVAF
jgi:hypothetical protein